MSSLLNAFCLRGLLRVMTAIRFAIAVSTMADAVSIADPPALQGNVLSVPAELCILYDSFRWGELVVSVRTVP